MLNISNPMPITRIVNIWAKITEKKLETTSAKANATKEVKDIIIPVLNALNIFSFIVPSSLFKTLFVNRISVSTLYPISIKKATIPALDIFIPKIFTNVRVIKMSAKAEITTAAEGRKFLNIRKITIAIKRKAIKMAKRSCL